MSDELKDGPEPVHAFYLELTAHIKVAKIDSVGFDLRKNSGKNSGLDT